MSGIPRTFPWCCRDVVEGFNLLHLAVRHIALLMTEAPTKRDLIKIVVRAYFMYFVGASVIDYKSQSVRHVTGTGSGLLGKIPRVVVQKSALL